MKLLFRILGLGLLLPATLLGQSTSDTWRGDSLTSKAISNKLLLQGSIEAAPLVGLGLLQSLQNEEVRQLRYGYFPNFRHHFDDYLQFAPLVAQVGMRLGGLEGASQSNLQAFTADALASASMMAITSAIKYTARVRRPDGSTRNSFPSGHTAMAFTAATLLAQEYGQRYPWVAVAGYSTASLVGLGRLLNNRHWIGDVVTGAGLGILSGHLGYWMADRIFGGSHRRPTEAQSFSPTSSQLFLPITISTTREVGDEAWSQRRRRIGLGLHYTPQAWPVYLKGEVHLALSRALPKGDDLAHSQEYRSLMFRLGLGREQHLWQNFYLQASAYATLRQGLGKASSSADASDYYLSGSKTALGLGLELAPTWRLTECIGLRIPLAVDYYPSHLDLIRPGLPTVKLSGVHYTMGTALAVYF